MKMHVLSGGRVRMYKHIYVPSSSPEETVELPVACYLFRHAHANVLFDTGCHPNVAANPEARWGEMARDIVPVMPVGDHLLNELGAMDLGPEDIDVVVNSHLHCDHCGCNEFFTRAAFYVHADELEAVRQPRSEGRGYFRADWDHPMPVNEVTGETDLLGDGCLTLLPLPGHTPGQIGLLAELPTSGAYLLASDALPMAINLDPSIVPKNNWNAERYLHSLSEIARIGKSGATVLCGHDEKQWDELRGTGGTFE